MRGIFAEEESQIQEHFLSNFRKEIVLFEQLLTVYASFIQVTSGKIKDNDFPNWTILMLLSQTLPLMNNALNLLTGGYLRSSEIMIRVASEAIILSTYFKEFPEAEIEYRTVNYRDFFHNHKIEDMLKKVEKEGRVFISDKEKAKQIMWNKIVFTNLFKESSRFLHNNSDLIYDLTIDNTGKASIKGVLVMGPQVYSDESFSMGLRRLFNALLFSLVVLGVSLNIVPDDREKDIIDQSSNATNDLNKYDKDNKKILSIQ